LTGVVGGIRVDLEGLGEALYCAQGMRYNSDDVLVDVCENSCFDSLATSSDSLSSSFTVPSCCEVLRKSIKFQTSCFFLSAILEVCVVLSGRIHKKRVCVWKRGER
jgi:hypothetical protein